MARKCFISFKHEDVGYKLYIQNNLQVDMIDKSLNESIDSEDLEYIMQQIRKYHLSDSTVTIHLIGQYSAEALGEDEQQYIKRELQASLYHRVDNTKNGILGVVLPSMYNEIYKGSYNCDRCGGQHTYVRINDSTVVKEFSYNYYIPNGGCSWDEDDRYCVLVRWDDFIASPEHYIECAFVKRSQPISNRTKVRP